MKKRNKKNNNKFLKRRMIAIILIFFIILSVRNLIYQCQENIQKKQIRLLFDNEYVITQNDIYIEEDNIYISEDDIKDMFDKTIYYNVGDKELITTYNKHVAVMHLNEKKVLINDASFETEGELKEFDSKIYLPINDLEIVYDLEVSYAEQTNRVIMNSTAKRKAQSIVLNKARVTRSKLPFSLTLEKVKRGEEVSILQDEGKYKKVRTNLGNIGYIKSRKISDEEIVRENLQEDNSKINLLEDYSDITQKYDSIEQKENEDNFTIIDAFTSKSDGSVESIIDTDNKNVKQYFEWANQNEVRVIGNFKNKDTVSSSMSTYTKRNKIINDLYEQIMQKQYKGICIDFNEIDDTNSFYRFIIELTPKFKESGLKVLLKKNDQIEQDRIQHIVDKII